MGSIFTHLLFSPLLHRIYYLSLCSCPRRERTLLHCSFHLLKCENECREGRRTYMCDVIEKNDAEPRAAEQKSSISLN